MTAFRMSERSASRRAGSVDRGAARLPSPAPAYAIHVPRSARPPPPPPLHGRWSSPRGTESLRSASSAGSLGAYVATAGRDAEARRRAAAMTEAIRAGRRHAASPAATWSPRRSPARLRTAPARVTQLCDESAPAPAFCFARRDTPFDWRQLTALSVEQIRRDTDVAALDRVLDTVAFGDAAANDLRDVDPNVLKVLQLAQLTIEYLLHCQATRQAEGDDLAAALSRADVLSATQADRNDALEAALHDLKKENRQLRKTLYAYQMVTKLPAGHNTAGLAHYYDCAWCTKVFTTPAYLRSHCERRHPDQLERETPAADAASHPLAPAPAPAPVPAPAPAPPAVEPRPSETDKIEAMLHAFQSQVLDAAQRMHREVAENERHEKRHEAEVSALLKDEHARLAAELAEMRRLLELQRAETLASADRERAERDAVARAERAPTAHGASTVAMADESFSDDEPPAPPAPAPPAPAPATIVVADPAVRDDIDALRRDMQQEADRFDAAQLRIAQLEAVLAHHQRLREAQTQTPALPEAVQPPSPPAPVALPTPPLEPIVAAPPPAPAPAAAPASMLQPAAAPAKKALKSAMKPPPGLTWTQVRNSAPPSSSSSPAPSAIRTTT
ncbi:hypothetical protein CXG81DRAFT_20068 [Caulochytrium protostelioides]|uniref:C2H2-type domain-containing protein n=1 Tax=Caulochytrium protostelioides TaxID=1555241 RepID=A0A4P9X4E2_9FUNG|nr:hypothetical protein CXG81DRAFT_20068 [Caulochytrium protostelioides]|eukprot:RKO99910.1 hypothetical protein CXG81DRAFT_20068 [Caulochytrium protostelioides]